MLLDNLTLFSDAQAIVATAVSTNVLDMLQPGKRYNGDQLKRRIGLKHIPLLIQVVEDFDNLTTLQVTVQVSSDEAFTSPVNVMSETIALADLKAGYISKIDKVPRDTTLRYMRLNYTVVGTAPTAGKVTAGIVAAVDGAYRG